MILSIKITVQGDRYGQNLAESELTVTSANIDQGDITALAMMGAGNVCAELAAKKEVLAPAITADQAAYKVNTIPPAPLPAIEPNPFE